MSEWRIHFWQSFDETSGGKDTIFSVGNQYKGMFYWSDTQSCPSFICQVGIEGPLYLRHSTDTEELKQINLPFSKRSDYFEFCCLWSYLFIVKQHFFFLYQFIERPGTEGSSLSYDASWSLRFCFLPLLLHWFWLFFFFLFLNIPPKKNSFPLAMLVKNLGLLLGFK